MPRIEYKHYLLLLLTAVATFNYLDRFVLSLAMESIKQDFALSDSQLGFLSGFAFASFYAIAGIPIARWADRGNRNLIVTLTTGLWSVMLVLCGLVSNFAQLLLARVGVAVGEAGCLPSANSLIADYFERAERPRAMAVYWLGSPLAIVIGYLAGGWLIESVGWRIAFVLIGLPGICLALLVKFSLKEPRLSQSNPETSQQPSFTQVIPALWNTRSLRHIIFAFSVSYFFGLGFAQWMPVFFMRSHAMGTAEIGLWFAFIWGGFAIGGTYLGGFLANRYAANQERRQMRWVAMAFCLSGLCYIAMFLSANKMIAMVFMALAGTVGAATAGPIFAAVQGLVAEKIRAVTLAIIFLLANFIGLGLGPVAVGLVSDLLQPVYQHESLRYAMVLFAPGLLIVGFLYWRASATVESDMRNIETGPSQQQLKATLNDQLAVPGHPQGQSHG